MIHFPNTPVRQRIGLDDNRYVFFEQQLREEGFRSLGVRNLLPEGSDNERLIQFTPDFVEIYNTQRGFHIYVSESSLLFYSTESSD